MKDKKKLIVIVLLLLLAVGFTGFGVYSYYWAQGTVSTGDTKPTIYLTRSFQPSVNGNYLGSGGSLTLTCPTPSDGDTSVTCTGSLTVQNDSTESISLSVSNATARITNESDKISLGSVSYDCPSGYISSNDSATVSFSVVATLGTGTEPEQVSEPVTGETVPISVDFELEATQYHSNGY